MIRVLVVDDDFRVAQLHAEIASATSGFHAVAVAHTATDAVKQARALRPDLVLLDEHLPDRRGSAILRELGAPAILITADTTPQAINAGIVAGAVGVIVKPFPRRALSARLVAFARFRAAIRNSGALDQAAIDRALAALHGADQVGTALPKGRSSVTGEAIVRALRSAAGPLTAGDVAEAVGVSRATAQRYLADLTAGGRVRLRLRYGAAGRPEHEYSWLR